MNYIEIKRFVALFLVIIFFTNQPLKSLLNLPVSPSATVPATTTTVSVSPPVNVPGTQPVVGVVAPSGALTTPGAAVVGTTQVPAAPVQLVLSYQDEKQIKDALNECAAPSTPVFGATVAEKSKYLIYEAIFKALTPALFPQISFETKLKIQNGLISDLVEYVLRSNDVMIKSLTDVNNLLTQSLVNIRQINDDISRLKSSEADIWKDRFKNALNNLMDRQSKLSAKLDLQNIFFRKLDEVQSVPSTQIKEKRDKLLSLVSMLGKNIINSLRDDFINNVARLVGMVQGETADQKSLISKFLDDLLAAKNIFTQPEQDKIKSFKQLMVTPPATVAPVSPTPVVPVLPIVQPPTSTVTTVAPSAAQVLTPTLPAVVPTVTPTINFLQDALSKLDAAGQDFDKIIDACDASLDIFSKGISFGDKQKLAQKIQEKVNFVYDKRASLKNEVLSKLDNLLNKAKNIEVIKNFITVQKICTVKIAILLNSAYQEEKNFQKFVLEIKKVVDGISKDVANYEKTRLSDTVDSLFVNRKNEDVKKVGIGAISTLKELLDSLNTPAFVAKDVFSTVVQNKFASYLKVISALLTLLKPTQSKDLKSQLDFYRPTLEALIIPETDYEKDIFFEAITQIYGNRGNFGNTELDMLKNFLVDLMNKQGLLSLAARSKLETDWIVELNNAISITPNAEPNKVYLEALIEMSMRLDDFAKNVTQIYPKIFSLFTSDTSVKVINVFLVKINDLVKGRDRIDKKKLLDFLSIKKLTIDKTGINEIASMLPEKQKETLRIWIKTITDELNALRS